MDSCRVTTSLRPDSDESLCSRTDVLQSHNRMRVARLHIVLAVVLGGLTGCRDQGQQEDTSEGKRLTWGQRLSVTKNSSDRLELVTLIVEDLLTPGEGALGVLKSILQDGDPKTRLYASLIVGDLRICVEDISPSAVANVIDGVTSGDERLLSFAAEGLVKHAASFAQLEGAVRKCLRSQNPEARNLALRAIEAAGPKASAFVPEVRVFLSDSLWNLRVSAAMALGKIGAPARPALPDLRKLLDDRLVESAARIAIAQIEGVPE